jgi:hypothetical protein
MRLLFRRCAAKIALQDGTFVMLWTDCLHGADAQQREGKLTPLEILAKNKHAFGRIFPSPAGRGQPPYAQ